MKSTIKILLPVLFLFTACQQNSTDQKSASVPAASLNLDLDDAKDNLTTFVKVRGSLTDDEEVLFYASGTIYGFVNGERDKPLMGFEMYNISKMRETEPGSYELLTREVGLYKDLKTGEVLDQWKNPYTEEMVDVLHVWNDPVNQKMQLEGKYGKWGINHSKLGDDVICMNADIFLIYPSPLKVADYPKNSQSDNYEAAELFQFFFSEKDINNPEMKNVPAQISWTRIGPWLPWMEMGQREGNMVYQCSGYKLNSSDYDAMPENFRKYIMEHHPEYRHAPDEFSKPNETSWTYFKKQNPKK